MQINKKELNKIAKTNHCYINSESDIRSPFSIGYGTYINGKITIKGLEKCTIGSYCAFGFDIKINTSNHLMNRANLQVALQHRMNHQSITSSDEVIIGNNVWVGDNATTLAGTIIGDGAVIGAGAIVTRSVKPFDIVVGSPAKAIRSRFSENVIDQLLEIKWWDWSEEKIKRNEVFFNLDLTLDPNINLKGMINE